MDSSSLRSTLVFLLIDYFTEIDSTDHGASFKRDIMYSTCSLHFIPEGEQERSPKGRYVSAEGDALFGSFPLSYTQTVHNGDTFLTSEEASHVMSTSNRIILHMYFKNDTKRMEEEGEDGDEEDCLSLPENINHDGDFNFIELTTEAKIPGLDKMMKKILKPILSPIQSILGGVIGSTLGVALRSMIGQEIDTALDDHITARLTSVLIPHLTSTMAPPIIETLAASVTTVFYFTDRYMRDVHVFRLALSYRLLNIFPSFSLRNSPKGSASV
jgi:hypothetical protein